MIIKINDSRMGFFKKPFCSIKLFSKGGFLKLTLEIIEYKREGNDGSFVGLLKDPTFCILISEGGKVREVAIKVRGEFPSCSLSETSFYEEEAYRNYKIIKNFIISDEGQGFLDRINIDEDVLVLGLYKALVKHHSYFGWFKKKLLVILEYLKYYSGKLGMK